MDTIPLTLFSQYPAYILSSECSCPLYLLLSPTIAFTQLHPLLNIVRLRCEQQKIHNTFPSNTDQVVYSTGHSCALLFRRIFAVSTVVVMRPKDSQEAKIVPANKQTALTLLQRTQTACKNVVLGCRSTSPLAMQSLCRMSQYPHLCMKTGKKTG